MNWLASVFKRHEPDVVEDALLGRLTVDPGGNWMGQWPDGPHGPVEVFVCGDGEPPSDEQSKRIADALASLPDVWRQIGSRTLGEIDEVPEGTTAAELFDSLRIENVAFWDLTPGAESWTVSCANGKKDHLFSFHIEAGQYRRFTMDE